MRKELKSFAQAVLFSIIPTVLIWLPFIFRFPSFWNIPLPQNGIATLVANYDGPLYIVAAKTLYNKEQIKTNYQFPLPAEYYTAHFPLFPVLIRLFSTVTNYPYATLLVTLLSSILAIHFFRKIIAGHVSEKETLFLTFLFSIFPARWLVVRSIGSADPLFVAGIIGSIYYFKNKKIWLAAFWGAVATFTKSPGILLFVSFTTYLIFNFFRTKKIDFKKYLPTLFIPLALFSVFLIYYFLTGDFWAYFHSGDNIHLMFPPFQIFNSNASWVGTFWLEEIIFVYLIGALGVYKLFEKKEYEMTIFTSIFFFLTLFIAHRDLLRYSLPIVPFLFVGFSDILVKKEFKIALLVIIIPIYLFSLSFISQNVMPIANWAPFL